MIIIRTKNGHNRGKEVRTPAPPRDVRKPKSQTSHKICPSTGTEKNCQDTSSSYVCAAMLLKVLKDVHYKNTRKTQGYIGTNSVIE